MNAPQISDRSRHILKALIDRYIREGLPVGSKSLVEETGLSISSATMRNVMSDLEAHGLVSAPHTSAGRVPTEQGYRLFVDSLINVNPIDEDYVTSLRQELNPDKPSGALVESASNLLSQLTSQAGIVLTPKTDSCRMQQVEFVPLSGNRVLVVLVINDKDVENRIIHTQREFSRKELAEAARYINGQFAGLELSEVSDAVLASMHSDKESINELMQLMMEVAVDSAGGQDCVVAGQNNLLDSAEAGNVGQLKELFDAFQYKKDILMLMNHCMDAQGIKIFIGHESGYQPFEDYSLITAPYQSSATAIGVIGIIGPTRMQYERVIPVVDLTAKMLSAALKR
ncbi:MAG: heat-inducible transcriptional repressor HrcA [Pseudomonadales bacterium]